MTCARLAATHLRFYDEQRREFHNTQLIGRHLLVAIRPCV